MNKDVWHMDVRDWLDRARQRLKPHARTLQLAGSYLLIIMVMSLSFSAIFYNTSAHEIDRQRPPDSLFGGDPGVDFSQFHTYFADRISRGHHDLLVNLALINLAILLVGAFISYVLARRTLEPIEHAIEAQSRFASDASHELRTPLAAIQTENEVALRSPKLSLERAKEIIASNLEEAVRLRGLADGLLRLAREDNIEVELVPLQLTQVVASAVQSLEKSAEAARVTIDNKVPPQLYVESDQDSLCQIVSILLDNAIKYSHGGGSIDIKARRDGQQAVLSVRDRGIGIRPEDLPHIFDRFYRADSSRSKQNSQGHGLGLSLAAQLAEQIGATIGVKSTVDKGSTFSLHLPAVEDSGS